MFNYTEKLYQYIDNTQQSISLLKNKKLVIFGTGEYSKVITRFIELINLKVNYYVDNNCKKWGETFNGIEIKSPKALRHETKEKINIVIASMFYSEIADQLKIMGFSEDQQIHKIYNLFPLLKLQNQFQSRYDYLIKVAKEINPKNMIEIGVWKGDRAETFLASLPSLKHYVGFDLFEDMTTDIHNLESMGNCYATPEKMVYNRIYDKAVSTNCRIELIKGDSKNTLPQFGKEKKEMFDFIFIDGGHSVETIENDWEHCKNMLSENGVVVFDDYYLNDDTRGAKKIIDMLAKDKEYVVEFFPMIHHIIDGLQITMVMVKRKTTRID